MALNIARLDYIILRAIMQHVERCGSYPMVTRIQRDVSDATGAKPTTIQDEITDLIARKLIYRIGDYNISVTSAGELWTSVVYPELAAERQTRAVGTITPYREDLI